MKNFQTWNLTSKYLAWFCRKKFQVKSKPNIFTFKIFPKDLSSFKPARKAKPKVPTPGFQSFHDLPIGNGFLISFVDNSGDGHRNVHHSNRLEEKAILCAQLFQIGHIFELQEICDAGNSHHLLRQTSRHKLVLVGGGRLTRTWAGLLTSIRPTRDLEIIKILLVKSVEYCPSPSSFTALKPRKSIIKEWGQYTVESVQ